MKTKQTSHDHGTELIERVMTGFRLVGYLTGATVITTFVLWTWFS